MLHGAHARHPGHHQLHGHASPCATWTTGWAADVDLVSNDHYLDAADPDATSSSSFSADLTRGLAGGRPVVAHGALDQRRQLAAAQRREDARPAARATAWRHVARGADARAVLPVAGSRGRAPRSSTRRCCRTPAPTRRCGARSSRSARTSRRIGEVAGSVVRADVAMRLRLARAGGPRELDSPPDQRPVATSTASTALLPRAVGRSASTVDFVAPAATCPATGS